MRIIIQRHGEPDVGVWGKITSKEMSEWIKIYNKSGVVVNCSPCTDSVEYAKNSFVICSTLERSRDSARLLKIKSYESNPVFCEAELPVVNIPLLRISPHTWSVIFRVFWFVGLSKNVESRKEMSKRVQVAHQKLEELAEKHTNVLLIGHGIMNRLIAKELLRNGWSGENAPNGTKYYGYSYWEYSVFKK